MGGASELRTPPAGGLLAGWAGPKVGGGGYGRMGREGKQAVNKCELFQVRKQQALWREDISAGAQGSHNLAKVGGRAENTLSKLRKKERWGI